MIKLSIPLHLQTEGSEDCGPTSTLMILDYFGITSDAQEVIAKVPRCNFGTSTFDNALTMMDYGLSVELVMAQPDIFDGEFIRSKPEKAAVIARVKQVIEKEKDQERQDILRSLITYVERGGKLTLAIPSKEIIQQAVKAGRPVMASMYTEALGRQLGGYHFVVIGGYNDHEFLIFNPWPTSKHISWERVDEVMFAIHSSTLFDYDNGAILLVDKLRKG